MATGSAALSSNVWQGAAAEPSKRLTETLREPVTGTRHSCIGGQRKGERWRGITGGIIRVDGRHGPAFARGNGTLISPRVGR